MILLRYMPKLNLFLFVSFLLLERMLWGAEDGVAAQKLLFRGGSTGAAQQAFRRKLGRMKHLSAVLYCGG